MARHEKWELQQMQSLSLESKISMTIARLKVWIDTFGVDGVYVAFSGGKDSTVLLDIVRNRMGETEIPAVFVDTGLEYPEIREFVKTFDNVVWLRPEMNFKQVIEKYGYPLFSKENALYIAQCQKPTEKNVTSRRLRLEGIRSDGVKVKRGFIPKSLLFAVGAPFLISNKCCEVMKKRPFHRYAKKENRKPITAQMASEGRQRERQWLNHGCNMFDVKEPKSNPMSFWTEQDVLLYIKKYKIPICSVYGDIVEDVSGTEDVSGQMTISDIQGFEDITKFDASVKPLKTTGCDRTGCMFCGFGCHLEKGEGRFERMKRTHPKQYEWIMKPWEEGGLNYKAVIDWINENGNLNIRY